MELYPLTISEIFQMIPTDDGIRDAHLAAEDDDDEGSLFPATEATSSSMSTSEQSSCKLSS